MGNVKPICLKCGNEELFEVEESNYDSDKEGNTVLVEKVKCAEPGCGALHKAILNLVSWKEWKNEQT